MGPITSSTPLPPEITTLITTKAQRLVGRYRFTKSDRQEIEQQISLDVVRKRDAVPGARALQMGFLIMIVERAVADIIAARKAACRDYRREGKSLDEWAEDNSGQMVCAGQTLTDDDAAHRLAHPGMEQEELRDLTIDMSLAAAAMPARLREVCEHLKDLRSPRAVAKAMGLHHSTVYNAIKQIKALFDKAGLRAYLPAPNSTRHFQPPSGR